MRIADYLLPAARLLLAAVFLLGGATKLVDPVGFRKGLRDFGLPRGLLRPMLIMLPVLELAVAAALIPSSLAWYGAWGALALLAAFLIALCTVMVLGRRPDCHCFGQLHSARVGWRTLVRNGLLIACAALTTPGEESYTRNRHVHPQHGLISTPWSIGTGRFQSNVETLERVHRKAV